VGDTDLFVQSANGRPVMDAARRRTARRPWAASVQGYLFLVPALVVLAAFVLGPGLWVFGLSLFKWDLIGAAARFLGGANYTLLARDPVFWQSLGQTVYFVAVSVPAGMAISLGLALLLNARFPLRGFFRGAVFVPFITPAVATIVIWQWIFNGDYGLLNALLGLMHLPRVAWLTDPRWIMPAVIVYTLWSTAGFNMVIFLAGLSNIAPELQDAARVDGAGRWRVFRHVTWPLLTPTTYFVLLISVINSFKVFNAIYVLTGSPNGVTGGPNRAAMTSGVYLYKQAFEFFRAGYASAISVVLFVIVLALTLLQMAAARQRVFYR
jgi:ABC-type sugar transport system permease subunit